MVFHVPPELRSDEQEIAIKDAQVLEQPKENIVVRDERGRVVSGRVPGTGRKPGKLGHRVFSAKVEEIIGKYTVKEAKAMVKDGRFEELSLHDAMVLRQILLAVTKWEMGFPEFMNRAEGAINKGGITEVNIGDQLRQTVIVRDFSGRGE